MDQFNRKKASGTCLSTSHNPAFADKMDEIVGAVNVNTASISALSIEQDMVFYVDGDAGDDTNDGLTLATAFKTFDFLKSNGVTPLQREINADVIVNCKGVITTVNPHNLEVDNFYGAGSLLIQGEFTDLFTGELATGWDVTATSPTKGSYLEATPATPWVVNAYKGKFINITAGTGYSSSDHIFPIKSNTVSKLETINLPDIDGTTVFSIVEGTKFGTTTDYAMWVHDNTLRISIKTFDLMDLAPASNAIHFGLGASGLHGGNNDRVLMYYVSSVAELTISECRAKLISSVFFATDYNPVSVQESGYAEIFRCIFVGDGTVLAYGVQALGPKAVIHLNNSRITEQWMGISVSDGNYGGGKVSIQDGNLFDNCNTAIEGLNNDIAILGYASAGALRFVDCVIAISLSSNTFSIGKSVIFYFSGVTTEVKVDSVITALLADITANKEISNGSGGSITYYDRVNFEAYIPPRVDKRVMSLLDVSNPPSAAELTGAFGTPAEVGAGFTVVIDDNDADTAVYTCISNGTSWWTFTGVKAV